MMLNVHCLCKMKDNKILSKTKIYEVLYLGYWFRLGSSYQDFGKVLFFFFFCVLI